MKTKIHIFYTRVMDLHGKEITIGGIQNYLISLCDVFKDEYDVSIIQTAHIDFSTTYNGHNIVGYKTNFKNNLRKQIKSLYVAHNAHISKNDFIIWGSDRMSLDVPHKKVITIQHGISFDYIPYDSLKFSSLFRKPFFAKIYKLLQNYKAIQDFTKSSNVVCVDYNYVNWIRTVYPREYCGNLTVIPNYSAVSTKQSINEVNLDEIKILFARRFQFMRGVNILIEVIDAILPKYNNVSFTICGEGPMESVLKEKYDNNPKVTITKYGVGEGEAFNLDHHISLVPTYGSEGTSFSLLESMGAGSVPLASNVGGMTNIILDGFNGYLLSPDSNHFIEKLSYLLDNKQELVRLSIQAKKTIHEAFSKDLWAAKWKNVLHTL